MTDKTDAICDRRTYLAWRADWRRRYADASQSVRATKRCLAAIHAARRAGAMRNTGFEVELESLIYLLPGQRRAAHALMIERGEATARRDEILIRPEMDVIAAMDA